MSLIFQNPGLIDMTAVTTMGISVKESDNPIGIFGTGLKYAIAGIIRHNGSITIIRGMEVYRFAKEEVEVRKVTKNIVTMNGDKLGYSEELGKHWEAWHLYRELYCNCLDEGGEVILTEEEPVGEYDTTKIIVECAALDEVHTNRHKYFLNSKPIYSNGNIEIHAGATNSIYYKGVLVHNHSDTFHYTYNILSHQTLTEDRTLMYPWSVLYDIQENIRLCEDEVLLMELFSSACYENKNFNLETSHEVSKEMVQVAEFYARTKTSISSVTFSRYLHKIRSDYNMYEVMTLTKRQTKMLETAINTLTKAGYPVTAFPIVSVTNLGKNVLGLAEDQTIYLSEYAYTLGTKTLTMTLLEEYVHNKTGFEDFSRELQTYFLGELVTKIEELTDQAL